jgi:hypothetical protein
MVDIVGAHRKLQAARRWCDHVQADSAASRTIKAKFH